jgi:hypothetical protein
MSEFLHPTGTIAELHVRQEELRAALDAVNIQLPTRPELADLAEQVRVAVADGQHPWSPVQRFGCQATTPRSAGTATSGIGAADWPRRAETDDLARDVRSASPSSHVLVR